VITTTTSAPSRPPFAERVAGWSAQHRAAAIAGWLGLVVLSVVLSVVVTGEGAPPSDPGESGVARRVLDGQGSFEPIRESVLVQPRTDSSASFPEDARLRTATADLVSTLEGLDDAVMDVQSPLEKAGNDRVSADDRSGLVTFFIPDDEDITRHFDAATAAVNDVAERHPDLRIVQSGDLTLSTAVDRAVKDDFSTAEKISLPVTVLILLMVFGSLVAAGIPVLLTATSVIATFSLLQVIDLWTPINSATSSMVLLIGVAVGVDYCLFSLRRLREERAAGRDLDDAIRIAARTSGRVILVSGVTVIVCLSGLLLTGISNFVGLTIGASLVVALAVLASMTALPALLAALGSRVDRGRVPWLGRRRTQVRPSRLWTSVAEAVVRKPVVWGGAAAAALVVMALPAAGMHLQDAAVTDSLPRSVAQVDAAERMQETFPGAASPARVVVWNRDGSRIDPAALDPAVRAIGARAAEAGGATAAPITEVVVDRALVIRVPLAGSGTDPTSVKALDTLRDTILPATVGKTTGVEYAVMGKTAFAADFTDVISAKTPVVVGVVLVLAFVLLLVAFRSVAIPAVSIVLTLLSVGAAYGALTWLFQGGHAGSWLGFTSYGGVISWLPLFMFVLVLGLSMDYHIFILSRVRERLHQGASPMRALVDGVGSSAGVVTTAAVVMVSVFSIFVVLSAIEYKMLGVGMAIAVLIDATLVRGVLLPAALAVLGPRAWSLPRWLEWLPGQRLEAPGSGGRSPEWPGLSASNISAR
jgi:RND superfamily putative drug exporter